MVIATSREVINPKSLLVRKISNLKGGQEWTLIVVLSKPVLGSPRAGFLQRGILAFLHSVGGSLTPSSVGIVVTLSNHD